MCDVLPATCEARGSHSISFHIKHRTRNRSSERSYHAYRRRNLRKPPILPRKKENKERISRPLLVNVCRTNIRCTRGSVTLKASSFRRAERKKEMYAYSCRNVAINSRLFARYVIRKTEYVIHFLRESKVLYTLVRQNLWIYEFMVYIAQLDITMVLFIFNEYIKYNTTIDSSTMRWGLHSSLIPNYEKKTCKIVTNRFPYSFRSFGTRPAISRYK